MKIIEVVELLKIYYKIEKSHKEIKEINLKKRSYII